MSDRRRRAARLRGAVALAGAALTAFLVPPPARAGGNLEEVNAANTQILEIWWDARAIPIVWKLNQQGVVNNCNNGNPACVGGVSPVTLQRAIDVLTFAFNAWQEVPTSKIAFTYGGTTATTQARLDAEHVMTWADTSAAHCPTGVVATTPSSRLRSDLTLTSTNRDLNADGIIDLDPAIYPNGTVLRAGTMVDADVAWCAAGNDFVDVPMDGGSATFDIGAVGVHELGHFHGLSHSSIIQPIATMMPFVDVTESYARDFRVLAQDDIASTSRYYPEPSFATDYGRITGRLFLPGSTTAADGVSVTAIHRPTGEQRVQVFSVTRFTATGKPAGSFEVDGLPPGPYMVAVEYFDGTATAGFDSWWDNNRFNWTIANSNISSGTRPPHTPRPEFFSSPEDGADDLAETTIVDVGAGAATSVGSIFINTNAPPVPAGATALRMANGSIVQATFPAGFSFPFYGTSYTSAFVSDNGNVTFGFAPSTGAHTGNFLGPDPATGDPVPPRIGLPMTNMDPGVDNQGPNAGPLDVFTRFVADPGGMPANDRFEIIVQGVPVIQTLKSNTVILRLFRSGRIEIQARFVSAWWGILGVSPGGDGTEPAVEIDLSRQLPFSGAAGQAVYEHFEFAQDPALGGNFLLEDANDTNGALVVFVPNAAGGYDLTSPGFAAARPGEVTNLRFQDAVTLLWDALPGAAAYNLYRGTLGAFSDTNGDGVAESYGSCLIAGLTSATATDGANPGAGSVHYYLATGRNLSGEGPLGSASNGLPQPNTAPCP